MTCPLTSGNENNTTRTDMAEENTALRALDELIALARSGELDAYCVYGPDGDIETDGRYLVAAYPEVHDDQEVYPREATERGFWLLYAGDQFTDVVNVAYDQASRPSREQISEALRYYSEHDTFLEL
jgi:hypothetical protein